MLKNTYNKEMGILKLAQITDIHIGPTEGLYNGTDVRAEFLKVLDDLQSKDIDYIILSGDLALDYGEAEAYEWIKVVLDNQKLPYLVMAGNHDSVERMANIFGVRADVQNYMLFYQKNLKGFPVFFLDSEPDIVATQQLQWLKEQASKIEDEVLLFMHHPPILCGCQFMDRKYPLRNLKETQSFINDIPNIKNIFVGHYHTEKVVKFNDKTVYLTPSTQMRISQTNPEFEMEPQDAGWRYIEWDGTSLKTKVIYV